MPDTFTNQRPYYDVTFPTSGDGFSISAARNAFMGLGFMDFIPLQPRAHAVPDMKILVRGRDASNFFNPVYYGNADQRIAFVSGDSPTFSAPVSNPRIDVVYITPSGDIKIQQGTEAVSPTLPSLSPSGDSRTPVCAVYLKPGMTRIMAFENKDSSTGDGYIYQDLRPWLRTAGAGSTSLGSTIPVAPTGDAQASSGALSTAAKSDHVHGGVHGVRSVGQALIQGDVELAGGTGLLTQTNNRITINSPFSQVYDSGNQTLTNQGALTLAHSLGRAPTLVQCRLVCLTAELGYAIGEQVIIDNNQAEAANNRGIGIAVDATNINIRFGNGTGGNTFDIIHKTTGASSAITEANWAFRIFAWA